MIYARLIPLVRRISQKVMDLNKYSSSKPIIELFATEKISKDYAQFRPVHSPETFDLIHNFCRETSNNLDFALDIGCGSGQSTIPLTKYFRKVIGLDVSKSQIAQTPSDIPRLSFRCSPAEELPFIETGTVDLITVAQAFHWFDQEKFYREADRVLKPGGSLVLYGYGNFNLDNKEAKEYTDKIYNDVLAKYWSKRREWIDTKYSQAKLPYEGWIRDDSFKIEKTWTVSQMVGYFSSWSSVNTYLEKHPDSTLLSDIRTELLKFYGSPNQGADEVEMRVTWPVFVIMGHKP